MQERIVAAVAHALTKNEYTNFIVETATIRAEEIAYNYTHFLQCGDYVGANMCFLKLNEHHRNFMAAQKALTALAKVAVNMGIDRDIVLARDDTYLVPPTEAE